MSLPLTDPDGRIYAILGGTPATLVNGVAYDSIGRMCVTNTLSATDSWLGGWRLSAVGEVVVNAQDTPVYNGGLPFNQALATVDSMGRQVDQVPNASDPYQMGIRVGPSGGVHLTTTPPP